MPLNNAERTNSFLFRHEAEMRSSVIGNVHYYINLSLDENSYCGTVRARFDVMQATKEHLFLEYAGKRIIELIFDDDVILDLTEIWQHHRLMLPAQWSLKPASHTISMRFENVYDNTGCGLFAYCEDSHIYIYSCFASNYAHTVFPCFDQPDIKGVF
jgi:aminopeptidase N